MRLTPALLASVVFAAPLCAQTVAPVPAPTAPAAKPAADDQTITLNPFVVESSSDKGWVATQSLAGSRLNTDLKDIAASIEVMTMEFMEDFALNSAAEASIYSTNVEGPADGVELGAGFGFGTGFPPATRVRGLRNATGSRNFFESRIGSDNYNLERVTIASGPNNLLFGTGSPAGVIDSTLKRGQFRDFVRVDLQFDSYGSQRYVGDVNKVLVKDKLAARFATVREEKDYFYKPTGYDHERRYTNLHWAPFRTTSIAASYEVTHVQNIRPQLMMPFDNLTPWYSASAINGYGHTENRPAFNNTAVGAALPALPGNSVFTRAGTAPVMVIGPNAGALSGFLGSFANTAEIKSPRDLPGIHPLNNEADGYTLLDGTHYPILSDLGGLSKLQRVRNRTANVFVTQQIGRRLFIELAAQKEDQEDWNAGMMAFTSAYTLRVDPNRFAPDGVTTNPNFGKRYVEGAANGPFRTQTIGKSTDWRASASYEYDFTETPRATWWRRLLGKHRLSGLASRRDAEDKQQELFNRILPTNGVDPVIPGITLRQPTSAAGAPQNGWATDGSRTLQFRYYLSDSDNSPRASYDLFGPFTFTDAAGKSHTIDMLNTGLRDADGRRLGAGRINTFLKSKFETKQLSYQAFLWQNRLVTTLGWRKDAANSAGAGTKRDPNSANPNANVSATNADLRTGLQPLIQDIAFAPYNDRTQQTGSTRTRGFIVRPLQGFVKLPLGAEFSLGWNRSSTFQPDVSNLDPFGNRVKGAAGGGEDKSVRLGLFHGKLSVRYTEFENTDGPARAANVPFNRFRFDLSSVLNRVMTLANGSARTPLTPYTEGRGFNASGDGDPYWVASDRVATGREINLDWNVTKNLQLRFNFNDQKVTESNIGEPWFQWLAAEIPKYQALTFPEGGVTNPRDLNGNGVIDTWNWNTAWRADNNQQTIANWYDLTVVRGSNGTEIIKSLDGRPNEFVRNNRWNLNASYRFSEGKLRGLSIGGAFRHRAAPVLAFNKKVLNGQDSLDVDNPYYGKVENLVDLSFNWRGRAQLWRVKNYRLGLNIRNVLDDTEHVDKLVNVFGGAIRRAKVFEGRVFVFSAGFEF